MEQFTKKQRRAIYLKLAKIFEEASTKMFGQTQEKFIYKRLTSMYLCSCLRRESVDAYRSTDLECDFPEFMLFEPTEEEKRLLEGDSICGSCSAWWDVNVEGVFEKKAIVLYLCAEMCK